MKSAIKTSEESWIEQQMLEDKKRATDWEATNEAIEEQVARESYLQWLQDQEKQARQVHNWFLPMCRASSERYTELHLQGCNQCFCVGRREVRKSFINKYYDLETRTHSPECTATNDDDVLL